MQAQISSLCLPGRRLRPALVAANQPMQSEPGGMQNCPKAPRPRNGRREEGGQKLFKLQQEDDSIQLKNRFQGAHDSSVVVGMVGDLYRLDDALEGSRSRE
ncbi:hypothetical protein [Arthrobacter sp. NyZ413]|uniref:hypothetical protein n=1 Tax=Arthrobacter sp. NyZ413 TaxID=3144669 RepID=UPI003BF8AE70